MVEWNDAKVWWDALQFTMQCWFWADGWLILCTVPRKKIRIKILPYNGYLIRINNTHDQQGKLNKMLLLLAWNVIWSIYIYQKLETILDKGHLLSTEGLHNSCSLEWMATQFFWVSKFQSVTESSSGVIWLNCWCIQDSDFLPVLSQLKISIHLCTVSWNELCKHSCIHVIMMRHKS